MLTFARVRAITILATLFVSAVVAVSMALTRDAEQAEAQAVCPPGFLEVDLTLPEASEVKVNVYNATSRSGLANQIGDNFANRDFQVLERGDSEDEIDGIAELHFGPQAVGAAQLVRAYFLNDARLEFDLARQDDVVDVVLGSGFRQLATPTEVHQAIAQAGNPTPPPGTCQATGN